MVGTGDYYSYKWSNFCMLFFDVLLIISDETNMSKENEADECLGEPPARIAAQNVMIAPLGTPPVLNSLSPMNTTAQARLQVEVATAQVSHQASISQGTQNTFLDIGLLAQQSCHTVETLLRNTMLLLFRDHPHGVFESELQTLYHKQYGSLQSLMNNNNNNIDSNENNNNNGKQLERSRNKDISPHLKQKDAAKESGVNTSVAPQLEQKKMLYQKIYQNVVQHNRLV